MAELIRVRKTPACNVKGEVILKDFFVDFCREEAARLHKIDGRKYMYIVAFKLGED